MSTKREKTALEQAKLDLDFEDMATASERTMLRKLGEKRSVRLLGMSRSTLARIAAGWSCHPETIARFRLQLEKARARAAR